MYDMEVVTFETVTAIFNLFGFFKLVSNGRNFGFKWTPTQFEMGGLRGSK